MRLGPDDDRGDGRADQQPGQRHLVARRGPSSGRELLDRLPDLELGRGEPRPTEPLVAADLAGRRLRAGQQPAVQRRERDDRQPEPHAGRDQLALGGPVDEVVLHLDADRRRAVLGPRRSRSRARPARPGGSTARRAAPSPAAPGRRRPGTSPPAACRGRGCARRGRRCGRSPAGAGSPPPAPSRDDATARGRRPRTDGLTGLGGDHDVVAPAAQGTSEDLLGGLALVPPAAPRAGRTSACARTRRRCRRR